jgi:hypothetical protein
MRKGFLNRGGVRIIIGIAQFVVSVKRLLSKRSDNFFLLSESQHLFCNLPDT